MADRIEHDLGEKIVIKPSETADTRSCDFSQVSMETLCDSSKQHIDDVTRGCDYFAEMLKVAGRRHDWDKLTNIEGFHADFKTGFEQTGWWDNHRKVNRHHLLQEDGIPEDINLIDVIEMIVDCVMAGKARTGAVYPLDLPADVLVKAFKNTAFLLTEQVVVEKAAQQVSA